MLHSGLTQANITALLRTEQEDIRDVPFSPSQVCQHLKSKIQSNPHK